MENARALQEENASMKQTIDMLQEKLCQLVAEDNPRDMHGSDTVSALASSAAGSCSCAAYARFGL